MRSTHASSLDGLSQRSDHAGVLLRVPTSLAWWLIVTSEQTIPEGSTTYILLQPSFVTFWVSNVFYLQYLCPAMGCRGIKVCVCRSIYGSLAYSMPPQRSVCCGSTCLTCSIVVSVIHGFCMVSNLPIIITVTL